MKNMSAKDRAFENERAKFRKEIRELNSENHTLKINILELKEDISEKDEQIRQYEEWIERLLEYMDISKEDLKLLLQKQKSINDIASLMINISNKFKMPF